MRFGAFRKRITGPLGMADTGFCVPARDHHRLASAFPRDPDTGTEVSLLEAREPPGFESGDGLGDAAGLAELVEADHRLCEEERLVPTRGHTPGHAGAHISSAGEAALITGDIAHHPCQFARPYWNGTADRDPAQAEAARRAVLGGLAGETVLVIGTHFAAPTAGRVQRDGEGFRLLACR